MITERVLLVEHKVKADSECPHIDLEPVGLAGVELGAHVAACPQHSLPDVGRFTESEISYFEGLWLSIFYFLVIFINFDQNIFHLYVAVQETSAMDCLEAAQDVREYLGGIIERVQLVGLLAHVDSEIAAVAKLKYDVDVVVVLMRFVELNHVLTINLFHYFDFVIDILTSFRVQFLLVYLLDCPLSAIFVAHQVDFAECSPADFPDYFVEAYQSGHYSSIQ